MNKEIEWFAYHCVTDNVITREHCQAIAQAFVEQGVEEDLTTFAQTAIDYELTEDVERLQKFMEMATQEAKSPAFPPFSVFEDEEPEEAAEPAAAEHEEAEAAEDEPDTAAAAPEEPSAPAGAASAPLHVEPVEYEGDTEWVLGWPDLSQAENMPPEQARELMNSFLGRAREASCSDVHVSAGARPFVRKFKQVFLLPDQNVITLEAAEKLNLSPLNAEQRAEFDKTHDLDYSYSITESDRYRTNVMLQRLGVAGSYRIIDAEVRSLRDLGFKRPEVIEKLTTYHQGLILLTGPAGCGKSTTMASLVDLINGARRDHIITVEDPIEVVHPPKLCNITQRELGTHTMSFANALRAALREDPDIIVIGELRDLETIEMAIRASETGHLVIGTLHTGSAASTMDRVLDVFPPNQQAQIRAMAAESLKGVVCQQLLPNKDCTDVVIASEIMLGTLAVSNLIREGKTYQLPSVIQTGNNIGMSTMEQSMLDLFLDDKRTYEQTDPYIRTPELRRQLQTEAAKRAAEAGGKKKKKGWFK